MGILTLNASADWNLNPSFFWGRRGISKTKQGGRALFFYSNLMNPCKLSKLEVD
jgi:hypothetical protein